MALEAILQLENQINDRVSFKVFIGLPFGDPSPDHSVISRFRDGVGAKAMERIHAELLSQLRAKGYSIDAGLAVDARLVRSASSPLSKEKTEKKREEKGRKEKEGTGKPMKFNRDIESDWTVKKGHFKPALTALHQGVESPVYHACEGGMGPDLSGDRLQYEAVVPGRDEESVACDGDLGTGASFGMEMTPDTRRMGMILAER